MLTSIPPLPSLRVACATTTVRPIARRSLAALIALLPLSFCIVPICAQSAEPVPAAVVQALKGAGIPLGSVGIVVEETGRSGSPLVAMNAGEPFNPASVMKLMTTYAALEMLGPASTWTTTLSLAEAPRNGVVAGDIYLQGSGDPKLTLERFWLLLHQLRDRGVRQIDGDLVLDRSLFAPIADNGAAFDDQPMRPYNVRPDALLLNFKALHLTLAPAGERIAVFSEPKPENLDLINLVKPGTGPCGDWKEGLRSDVVQHDLRYRLVLSGTYPLSCGEKVWHLAALPHERYVLGVFTQLWHELGGEFHGNVRDGQPPAAAALTITTESPTVAEVVRDINKFSNNVMARQLFLALAPDRPASAEAATRRVQEWLTAKNLSIPELVLDNGSGLSRRERISPANLTKLLQSAFASPLMPEFIASLPLTAVDGTMKKRLSGIGVAGQAHIKTGTLEGVKTIAGYVRNAEGRILIVVFLVNHPNASRAQAAQDALLKWAYEASAPNNPKCGRTACPPRQTTQAVEM